MKFMFNSFCPSIHQYIKDVTHCFFIALILIRNLPPYLFLTFCICQFFMFALRIFSLSLVLIQYRVSGCSFLHVFLWLEIINFLIINFSKYFCPHSLRDSKYTLGRLKLSHSSVMLSSVFFSLCILFCLVYIIVFL